LYRALRLPPAEETNAADITGGTCLLFIKERSSKRQFLVDTGSDLCVYPHRLVQRHKERVNFDLCAANGTTIHTYGWLPLSLNLGLRLDFTWPFVVADVTHPFIGVDFLSHFGLLVDCRNNRLLDGVTSTSVPAQAASALIPRVKTITGGTPIDSLLTEFPDLTRPAGVQREVRHNTVHHIRTIPGPPVTCRPRRLALDRLAIAKDKFDAMLRDGTARRFESSWSSALHTVPKKNNGWRPCGDYRALNSRTIPDRYPVRHIHDYSHQLFGCSIHSQIDLLRAYNRIPVHHDDVQKTAITTPFGIFEFPFMSFGLSNAADDSTHHGRHSEGTRFLFLLPGRHPCLFRSLEEHEQHLRALFTQLQRYGIIINPAKCIFRAPEVTFLAYKVSA
jgi:cleavage and polyadenylation specificity factor subunit 1